MRKCGVQSSIKWAESGPWGHGPISEKRLLCALQAYMKALTGIPDKARAQRIGFKEIRWDKNTLTFASTLFPCAQIITLTRKNVSKQSHSGLWHDQDKNQDACKKLLRQTETLEAWHRDHPQQTYSIKLEDFSVDMFNSLLKWIGVNGCHYTEVCHSNADNGYQNDTDHVHIEGTCLIPA
jgi:hypothetical protein